MLPTLEGGGGGGRVLLSPEEMQYFLPQTRDSTFLFTPDEGKCALLKTGANVLLQTRGSVFYSWRKPMPYSRRGKVCFTHDESQCLTPDEGKCVLLKTKANVLLQTRESASYCRQMAMCHSRRRAIIISHSRRRAICFTLKKVVRFLNSDEGQCFYFLSRHSIKLFKNRERNNCWVLLVLFCLSVVWRCISTWRHQTPRSTSHHTVPRQQQQEILPWPSMSTDWNPIERIKDELDKRVRGKVNAPANVRGFFRALQQKWVAVPRHVTHNLT